MEKTRQNAENKQPFDFSGKIKIEGEKLVKPLKINKLLVRRENLKLRKKLVKTPKLNKLFF